jgi:arylsulfatase A-like enzyme
MELEGGEEGEYLTDRLTEESVKFLEANKDRPFLLYHSYYTVHNPQEAKPELVEKYRSKAERLPSRPGPRYIRDGDRETRQVQDDPVYAGMVQSLDESVGRIRSKLEELGVAGHTAVVFMSDNGGLSTSEGSPTSNVPLRGGKGWLYEGGIREPMIVYWPGVTRQGSVCGEPVISNDFYPTMLEMAGLGSRGSQHVDGVSLVPLLEGRGNAVERPLFWHFPHYGNQGGLPGAAVRLGDFKLIEFFEDGGIELYDLKKDLSEQNNLARAMPEKAEELLELLHSWQERVNARVPTPNPDFNADEWESFHRRQRENSRR